MKTYGNTAAVAHTHKIYREEKKARVEKKGSTRKSSPFPYHEELAPSWVTLLISRSDASSTTTHLSDFTKKKENGTQVRRNEHLRTYEDSSCVYIIQLP